MHWKAFLNQPEFSFFAQDLKFSANGSALEASRIICFMQNKDDSIFLKNAMQTLREDLDMKSNLRAFPITRLFIFFEQYVITSHKTLQNLIIAVITDFVITSPFLVDCTVAILLLFNSVALIWGVSLNAIINLYSIINLVMAIGFHSGLQRTHCACVRCVQQVVSKWASGRFSKYSGCECTHGR